MTHAIAEALQTAHIESILRGISDDPTDFATTPQRFICPEIILRPPAAAPRRPTEIAISVNPRLSQTYAAILFMIAHGTPGASVIVNGTYAHDTMRRLFPDVTFHPLPPHMDKIRTATTARDVLYINFAWTARQQTDSPLAYERKSRKMIAFSEEVHQAIGAKASLFIFRTPLKVPYIINEDGSRRPTDHTNRIPNIEHHWVKQQPHTRHIDGITIVPPHAGLYDTTMRIVTRGAHSANIDNIGYHEILNAHATITRPRGYDSRIAAMIEKLYRTKFPRRRFSIAPSPQPKEFGEKKTWRRTAPPHD